MTTCRTCNEPIDDDNIYGQCSPCYFKETGSGEDLDESGPPDNMIEVPNDYANATKAAMDYLIRSNNERSARYIAAEKFLMQLAQLPWYKWIFMQGAILEYFKLHYKQYKF